VVLDGDHEALLLTKGYHKHQGGIYVTSNSSIPDVPIGEASEKLCDILSDFHFVSGSDGSRALASFITPALVFGGFLGVNRAPIDLALADKSQAGKTYRQKVVSALYGEIPYVIASKKKGVGGLEESFGHALLEGRPFVQIDNLRGEMNSEYIEAFMTAKYIGVRIPHKAEIEINASRFIVMLSSNDLAPTPDLLKRSSIIRIRKGPDSAPFRQYPEGELLEHVTANQPYYLGCVHSIVRAWVDAGRPQTSETRHSFRAWAQALDWMVQNLFTGVPPLLDGYDGTDLYCGSEDRGKNDDTLVWESATEA
jgi:hypothetical protein